MSDFVWETDQKGVITYFESGSSELTFDVEVGVTKDENIDNSEGEGDRFFIAQAIARQEPFRNLTFALRNKNDELRWVRISANPRFDHNGKLCLIRFMEGKHVNHWGEEKLPFSLTPEHKPDLPDTLAQFKSKPFSAPTPY